MSNYIKRFTSILLVVALCLSTTSISTYAKEDDSIAFRNSGNVISDISQNIEENSNNIKFRLGVGGLDPRITYKTIDRNAATVEYSIPGRQTGIHVITIIDQSVENSDAAANVINVIKDNYNSWIDYTGTSESTILYSDTLISTDWRNILGHSNVGAGESNGAIALSQAKDMLEGIPEGKKPVIFWVLSPDNNINGNAYLESTKVQFTELQGKVDELGGEIITWQFGDKPSNWLTGNNVTANAAKDDFNDKVEKSLAEVCTDTVSEFSIELPIDSDLVQGIENVSVSQKCGNYSTISTECSVSDESGPMVITIPTLYMHADLHVSFDLVLDSDKFTKETVISPSVAGKGDWLPILNEIIIDRARNTATFKTAEDGEVLSEINLIPGQTFIIPDVQSATGWVVLGSNESYKPGQMIEMPDRDITLVASSAKVELNLILGEVEPPKEIGNKMYGKWDSDECTEIGSLFDIIGNDYYLNIETITVTDEDTYDCIKYEFGDNFIYNGGFNGGTANAWYIGKDHYNPVVLYLKNSSEDSSKYDMFIAGIGGVTAPLSTASMFENQRMQSLKYLDLHLLNTEHVINMSNMFCTNKIDETSLIDLDLSGWDVSNVKYMSYMFSNWNALNSIDISGWDTSNVVDMQYMFNSCEHLSNLDVNSLDTSNVTDMGSMFHGCHSLTFLDTENWDTGNVQNMSYMFCNCNSLIDIDTSKWNVVSVKDMSNMFSGCTSLRRIDSSHFNTRNVRNMSYMFYGCSELETLDVSGWDTSSVTNIGLMFWNCNKLTTLDVSGWNTSNVTNMQRAFSDCQNLSQLDVSGWDTSNVTDISYMFYNDKNISVLELSGWDTTNVERMEYMFFDTKVRELDLSGWNLSSVTNIEGMFYGCVLLEIVNFSDTDGNKVCNNLINMSKLFQDCNLITEIDMGGWVLPSVRTMSQMLYSSGDKWLAFDASWTFPESEVDVSRLVDYRKSRIILKVGDYDASDISQAQKKNFINEFMEWHNLTQWNELIIKDNEGTIFDSVHTYSLNNSEEERVKITVILENEKFFNYYDELPVGTVIDADALDGFDFGRTDFDKYVLESLEPESITVSSDGENSITVHYRRIEDNVSYSENTGNVQANKAMSNAEPHALNMLSNDSQDEGEFVDNSIIDYSQRIPTATVATPIHSIVHYIVRVNYIGDSGEESGTISIRYPIPEGVVPVDDGSDIVIVGAIKNGTGIDCANDDHEIGAINVVDEFRIEGSKDDGYVLLGSLSGVPAGKHVDITVRCSISDKIDSTKTVQGDDVYYNWVGTAYAVADSWSCVSNPLRLWYSESETQPAQLEESRIVYSFVGDVPRGVELPDSKYVSVGDTELLNSISEVNGYEFDGWYVKTGDSISDDKVSTYTVQDSDAGSDIIFIGKWTVVNTDSITIKYRYAGSQEDGLVVPSSINGIESSVSVILGKQSQIANPTITFNRYEFAGWYKVEVNGVENTTIPTSGIIDTSNTDYNLKDGDVIVYTGAWRPEIGVINFNGNGATGISPASMTVELGNPSGELPDNTPLVKDGYRFVGWSIDADQDANDQLGICSVGEPVKSLVDSGLVRNNQTLVLYAVWEKDKSVAPVVTLIKYSDRGVVDNGDTLIYSVVASNIGSVAATDVVITDELPIGLTFVSASLNGEDIIPNNAEYSIGDIEASETVELDITVKVADDILNGSTLLNVATASSTNITGSVTSNESVTRVSTPDIPSGYATVTYPKYEDDTYKTVEENTVVLKGAIVVADPNGGEWIPENDEKWDGPDSDGKYTYDISVGDTLSLYNNPSDSARIFTGWKRTDSVNSDNVSVITFTAQWGDVTVVNNDGNDYVYSGNLQYLSKDGLTVKIGNDVVSSDKIEITSFENLDGDEVEPKDVGKYFAVVVVSDDSGNNICTTKCEYNIIPATLTVTTQSAEKKYDGEVLSADGSITGLKNDETVTFTVTGEQVDIGSSDNTYTLVWDGTAKESNYTVVENIGTLTVKSESEEDVIVTARFNGIAIYNGKEQLIDKGRVRVEVDGVPISTDRFDITGYKCADIDSMLKTSDNISPINAGQYIVGIRVNDEDGLLLSNTEVNYTINKAMLTAAFVNETVNVGDAIKGDIQVKGFVNGETETTASGYTSPTVDVSSISTGEVGTYTIIPTGGSADNYEFYHVPGIVTIVPSSSMSGTPSPSSSPSATPSPSSSPTIVPTSGNSSSSAEGTYSPVGTVPRYYPSAYNYGYGYRTPSTVNSGSEYRESTGAVSDATQSDRNYVKASSPKTGDDSNMVALGILCFIFFISGLYFVRGRKQEKDNE